MQKDLNNVKIQTIDQMELIDWKLVQRKHHACKPYVIHLLHNAIDTEYCGVRSKNRTEI